MRLVKCEKPARVGDKKRKAHIFDILMEFEKSGFECAEIVEWEHATSCSIAASLYLAIERYQFKNIKPVQRSGRIFLVRGASQ